MVDKKQNCKELYNALIYRYDLARERNETYINRSRNLLGFIGLIFAILMNFIGAFFANDHTRNILLYGGYKCLLLYALVADAVLFLTSFLLLVYILSILKYKPPFQIENKDYIKEVCGEYGEFSFKRLCIQISDAIIFIDGQNKKYYKIISAATILFIIAVIITIVISISLLYILLFDQSEVYRLGPVVIHL